MPLTCTTGAYITYPLGPPEDATDWEDFIITRNPDESRTAMTMSRFPRCAIVRHMQGDAVTSIVLPPASGTSTPAAMNG